MKCDKCRDLKHVLTNDGWVPCECLVERRLERNLADAGVPGYMRSMTWGEWKEKHPRAGRLFPQIKDYLAAVIKREHVGRFRCAYGASGSGKVTLAYLFVRECIRHGLTAKVVELGDLVADRFEDGNELTKIVLGVDLAVVRIGSESEHKFNAEILEKVHFSRKMHERPTLYTTRTSGGVWAQRYGTVLERAFWEAKEGDVIVWNFEKGKIWVP